MAARLPDNGAPRGRASYRGEDPQRVRADRQRRLAAGSDEDGNEPKRGTPAEIVRRRHEDWMRNHILWQRMLDSYEGGDVYRNAVYGPDRRGFPLRNLIRHRREYPDPQEFPNTEQGLGAYAGAAAGPAAGPMSGPYPGMLGADPSAVAWDDDYEYRRARTPIPEWVAEVIGVHVGKIYEQAIARKGPAELMSWWADCCGDGTPIGDWMEDTIAPLLFSLGLLDIVFDRPYVEEGTRIETRADEIANGLDKVVAAYILPMNMLWWESDPAGRYQKCLVREFQPASLEDSQQDASTATSVGEDYSLQFGGQQTNAQARYRYWTNTTVSLFDGAGNIVEPERPHGYPFVPIVRLIDIRRHRTPMIGKPRWEEVQNLQREYYNRSSELILSDTLQALPLLSGPEDMVRGDNTVSVGPANILPKPKIGVNGEGGYGEWNYIAPPKGPAQDIRANMQTLEDRKDRVAGMTKPAGATGTTGGTVAQSGFSKVIDADTGHKMLGAEARSLAKAEKQMAEYALMCARRAEITPADRASVQITYPSRFQLKQARELLDEWTQLVNVVAVETQIAVGLPGTTNPGGTPPQAKPPTPDDQAGGNPPELGATPATRREFVFPTLVLEKALEYARASCQSRDEATYQQIEREGLALFHLHHTPQFGTVSEAEAMMGHGTTEANAENDPMGQSGATSVSPSVPITD